MPWAETEPMKERIRFVTDGERGLYSMTELCGRYGISRRTGYKWLDPYEARGPAGLLEGSRAPRGQREVRRGVVTRRHRRGVDCGSPVRPATDAAAGERE